MGAYPDKALGVLRSVALRMEEWLRQEKFGGVLLPQIASTPDGRVSEEVSKMLLLRGAQRDVPFTLLCFSGSARRRKSVHARDVPCTESILCSSNCAVLSEELLYACSAHCKPVSCLRLLDCRHALSPCPPQPHCCRSVRVLL